MKKFGLTIMAAALLGFLGTALAGTPSAEQGKTLFNDAALGGSANPASCNTCHPDGRKLEQAGGLENLKDMINSCITRALHGKPLDADSPEMESLVLYIQSLGE